MGKDPNQLSRQEARSLVCAQCHVTYIIPKDTEMKSTAVFFPWQGSKAGDISVENIIKVIKSDPAHLEWKQTVTGFKVGFIRHPGIRILQPQQRPLEGRRGLRRLPYALHRRWAPTRFPTTT